MKDPKTTPEERKLMESWIGEFSLLNEKMMDDTAKKRLAELRKDISPNPTQNPAPVEDRPTVSQQIVPVSVLTPEQIA